MTFTHMQLSLSAGNDSLQNLSLESLKRELNSELSALSTLIVNTKMAGFAKLHLAKLEESSKDIIAYLERDPNMIKQTLDSLKKLDKTRSSYEPSYFTTVQENTKKSNYNSVTQIEDYLSRLEKCFPKTERESVSVISRRIKEILTALIVKKKEMEESLFNESTPLPPKKETETEGITTNGSGCCMIS